MDDTKAYPSTNAAEAVGERPGMEPPQTSEHAVRPVETSAGPSATIAEKTAEEVGERTRDAYADATTEEARERSRGALLPHWGRSFTGRNASASPDAPELKVRVHLPPAESHVRTRAARVGMAASCLAG